MTSSRTILGVSKLFIAVWILSMIEISRAAPGRAVIPVTDATVANISRFHDGDTFISEGVSTCGADACVGLTSGTAGPRPGHVCHCQCLPHLPAFREDLNICVDDIHECPLAPFVSASTTQKIPFVFLPLKGQIVHPSKEISFAGVQTPVCAVSSAQFLTEGGWIDLKNSADSDVPFRLFLDEGRTFLQWLGESDLRARMAGRLLLVRLMCRDLTLTDHTEPDPLTENLKSIFTPCVAFRVVGTPAKYHTNVSEVLFSPDAQSSESSRSGLTATEYIAIGICSVLLGLIYVASVFLYLHLRKRRSKESLENSEAAQKEVQTGTHITNGGDVIIKSNPLLGLSRHFTPPSDEGFMNETSSCTSEIEGLPDVLKNNDESGTSHRSLQNSQTQVTSVMIHPSLDRFSLLELKCLSEPTLQHLDTNNIERLPEENVSIVETVDDTIVKSIVNNSTRRKLYFNPAYFDPQLMAAPPPAAIEFLAKIREVITIAKHKMASKRFSPSLIGIPEEDSGHSIEVGSEFGKRRSSAISLKRENSRRRVAISSPDACNNNDFYDKLPDIELLPACKSCSESASESKKSSIQKWLEDVPYIKSPTMSVRSEDLNMFSSYITDRLKSSFDKISLPDKMYYSEDPNLERNKEILFQKLSVEDYHLDKPSSPKRPRKNIKDSQKRRAPKVPAPVIPNNVDPQRDRYNENKNLPPPDMINEAIVVDNRVPTITKEKMAKVISEFAAKRGLDQVKPLLSSAIIHLSDSNSSSPSINKRLLEYETDSLERSQRKGFHTPTEYGEVSSSHPSPSLSSALPLEEEMTMQNDILDTKTNLTIDVEEHEYETLSPKRMKRYNLPELLNRNNGYSFVSEVYVNNGYNFGSAPTSPSDSDCSSLNSTRAKIRYTEPEKPGHLLIEVEDCPANYIRVEDSDQFEPDTLDRKPSKRTNNNDSLERPGQILLRTTGSFKKDALNCSVELNNKLSKEFGSLREIYEAKNKNNIAYNNMRSPTDSWEKGLTIDDLEKGRILTLEERHARRQRKQTPPNTAGHLKIAPPDVILTNLNSPIYEHPGPPRKITDGEFFKPPLPPKNVIGRSIRMLEMASKSYEEDEEIASPNSTLSFDLPSTYSDASVNSSDTQGEDTRLCKHKGGSLLDNFVKKSDPIHRNINNQFILQSSSNCKRPKLETNRDSDAFISILMDESGNSETKSSKQLVADLHQSSKNNENIKRTWRKVLEMTSQKPEDSGYLSTDSNESHRKLLCEKEDVNSGLGSVSETDESLCDGYSESGAESVETHSVFFGSFRKRSFLTRSVDSGLDSELIRSPDYVARPKFEQEAEDNESDDMSFVTVLPLDNSLNA